LDNGNQEPAFQNKALIDKFRTENVVSKMLEVLITLTLGDLLKSDKAVREGRKKLLAKKRTPANEWAMNLIEAMTEGSLHTGGVMQN